MKNVLTITVFSFFVVSCVYNKKELPKPAEETGTFTPPKITYTSHAKRIIDTKCSVCHAISGTGQPPFLDTYTDAFNSRARIIGRAIDEIPTVMPPANPMSQELKDTLQWWVDQGALQ